MLRHYHVSIDAHREPLPHVFQTSHQQIANIRRIEVRLPAVTTECDEVAVAGLLEPFQSARHGERLHPERSQVSDPRLAPNPGARTWGTERVVRSTWLRTAHAKASSSSGARS